jgi:hypothetical protein
MLANDHSDRFSSSDETLSGVSTFPKLYGSRRDVSEFWRESISTTIVLSMVANIIGVKNSDKVAPSAHRSINIGL